jgi:glycosyltransferase involved in cell wall biosynthesis
VDSSIPPPAFLRQLPDGVPVLDVHEKPAVSVDDLLLFHLFLVMDNVPLEWLWPTWAHDPSIGLVVTMHDILPFQRPQYPLRGRERYVRDSRYRLVEQADIVITNSQWNANEVTGLLCVDPVRVRVASCGVSESYTPFGDRTIATAVLRAGLGIQGEFLFSAGHVDSWEYLLVLIRAFASLSPEVRDRFQLVLTCAHADRTVWPSHGRTVLTLLRDEARNLGVGGRVIIHPRLPETAVFTLYQLCHVFVFPCLNEELGLPVLRAMRCGAPTIVSDVGPMREMVRDPVARFNPSFESDVAATLCRVIMDEHFAESRRQSGLRDAARYTWDSWEASVLAAYDDAARRRP